MSDPPSWIQYLSAFLTPVIALTTAYIAVQQYLLARAKHRYDLYERRTRIFSETQSFIKDAVLSNKNTTERLKEFQNNTIDRHFLFGPDVNAHLDKLEKQTEDLALLNLRASQEREKGNDQLAEKFGTEFFDIAAWCTDMYSNGNIEIFQPYLKLKGK